MRWVYAVASSRVALTLCMWLTSRVCVHAYTDVCVCDDVVAVDHVLTEQNLAGDEYRAWRVHFY